MKRSAEVLIIGGGVMGVSLAFHLVREGWRDVVLAEKSDLTHGSTWHAAGLCTHFAHDLTIQALRARSVRLYRDILPAETGESCGFHPCGAMRVTARADRMAEFAHVVGLGRFSGHPMHLIEPEEIARLHPLARTEGLIGGIHEPEDGHVDPTLATQAMARLARSGGATILRNAPVRAMRQDGGGWRVRVGDTEIRARHLVNAAGTWGWDVGRMMGIEIPSVPILHQYLVTDTVPEIAERQAAGLPELPMIRDPDQSWYVRQERDGLILGPYERDARPWSVDGVPPDFGAELLPPDLERVEHIVLQAMERIPALSRVGIRAVVNGPITFTPDANPLVGPVHGLPGAWLLTGSSMGVMEGGGAGWFLARWMTTGAPPLDPGPIDPRRFGDWADRPYAVEKATECFGLQFGIHYPHEERPAGRNRRLSPLHGRLLERGAVMGAAHGWERPNWFAPDEAEARRAEALAPTFGRPPWLDAVSEEARAVAAGVGLADLSFLSKFEILGPDTRRFLETLGANRAPRTGRIGLTHALTPEGGVFSEFTVALVDEDRAWLTSAAAAEERDEDLLRAHADGLDVSLANRTEAWGAVALMGPSARDLLQRLSPGDRTADLPLYSVREIEVAGIPATALRISYVGEAGVELHAPAADLPGLFDALMAAGEGHGPRLFGAYAIDAMRLEKGYRAWGSDLTTERTPAEAGLGHLVRAEGRSFTGREALLRRMADPNRWEMVLLELARREIYPFHGHPVMVGDRAVGMVSSAAHGPRTGKLLALAWLRERGAREGLEIEVLGRRVAAQVLADPPWDPRGARMRW